CKFDSLVEAAAKLGSECHPDVLIAEPVGSCTDLVATVTYPLRRLYGRTFSVAPVSVLVDPIRAARVFGLERGRNFTVEVTYIYMKQLQEADIIVISKCDLMDAARLEALRAAIVEKFPTKTVLTISSLRGNNLDAWLAHLNNGLQAPGKAMQVDYK